MQQLELDGSKSFDGNYASSENRLVFDWRCAISSFGPGYWHECSLENSTQFNRSTLTVNASSVYSNQTFQFSLTVSNEDRYDVATVTVQPVGTIVKVFGISAPSQINVNDQLSVHGSLWSDTAVNARWSVYFAGYALNVTANLTARSALFSARISSASVQFPLGVDRNTFLSGRQYTFRLTGCERASQRCAYSEVNVYVNGPPTGGSLAVQPETGGALNQTFLIASLGWIDDINSYPLLYKFAYELSNTAPSLALSLFTTVAYTESVLPQGLTAMDSYVTLIGYVQDTFGAETSSVAEALVYADVNTNITAFVLAGISSFDSTGNINAVYQLVNTVASKLNRRNCSLAPNCISLNRGLCSSVANTCSSCLDGFKGVVGDSNTKCHNVSEVLISEVGAPCVLDSDCLYGQCIQEVCAAPTLTCANQCSGRGSCKYFDISGNEYDSCTIFDVFCSASCRCDDGYGGNDCSLSTEALNELGSIRSSLCRLLYMAAVGQDKSSMMLDNTVSALLETYSATEVVSAEDVSTCLSVLSYLAGVAGEGYIAGSQASTVQFLAGSISQFVDVSSSGSSAYLSEGLITAALDSMISGVSSSMLVGQSPQAIVANNIRVHIVNLLVDSLANITLTPPLTDAETAYGTVPSSITLPSTGLEACDLPRGHTHISIMQWALNPYNSSFLNSPTLRFSSSGAASMRRSLQDTVTIGMDFVPAYYVTMQFSTPMSLNFTAQRMGQGMANITLPECAFYDGTAYTGCNGCNISSYTNYNVTYACYDISVLCAVSSARRLQLDRVDPGRALAYTVDDDGGSATSIAHYSSLAVAIGQEIGGVLSENPFAIKTAMSRSVLVFVSGMVIVLLIGCIVCLKWDSFERNKFIYIQEGKRKDKKRKKEQYRNRTPKSSDTLASVFSFVGSLSSDTSDEDKPDLATDQFAVFLDEIQLWEEESKSKLSRKGSSLATIQWVQEEILAYTDDSINAASLLRSDGLLKRTVTMIYKKHEYINFFSEWDPRFTRTVRWLGLWKSILIEFFINTIFFQIYYPQDGQCSGFTTQVSCVQQPSSFSSSRTLCVWIDSDNGDYCNVSPPSNDIVFVVILQTIFVILAAPIDIILAYVLEEFASKWPRLENIGLSTKYWFGSGRIGITEDTATTNLVELDLMSHDIADAAAAESTALVKLAYDDLRPVAEEVEALMNEIHNVNCVNLEAPFWHQDYSGIIDDNSTRAAAILETLGIYPSGEPAPLSIFERLFYRNAVHRLECIIGSVRRRAGYLLNWMKTIDVEEVSARDYFMIQSFVLDQFPQFKRFMLQKSLYKFPSASPGYVGVIEYVFSWFVVIWTTVFFIYWIFAWGVKNGGVTSQSWGWYLSMNIIQNGLFQNPLRICLIYVLAIELMRPQLKAIHRTLYAVAMRGISANNAGNFGFRVAQFTVAACRVARSPSAHYLPSSRLLRLIDDTDIQNCKNPDRSKLHWILLTAIAVPAILAVIGEVPRDHLLDIVLASLFSSTLLFFTFLKKYGAVFVAIPILGGIAWYFYRSRMLTPARRLQYERTMKHRKANVSLSRKGHSNTAKLLKHLIFHIREHVAECILFMSGPVQYIKNRFQSHETRRARSWQFMNSGRNPRLSHGSSSNPVVLSEAISLPEQIKAMLHNSYGNAPSSPTETTRSSSRQLMPEVFTFAEGMRQDLTHFRDSMVTSSISVALHRMLGRLCEVEANFDWNNENYVANYTDKYSFSVFDSQLESSFCFVWRFFHPHGFKLSPVEQRAVYTMFLDWKLLQLSTGRGDGAVGRFCAWFVRLCQHIKRIKSEEINEQVKLCQPPTPSRQILGRKSRSNVTFEDHVDALELLEPYFGVSGISNDVNVAEDSASDCSADGQYGKLVLGALGSTVLDLDDIGYDFAYDPNDDNLGGLNTSSSDLMRSRMRNNTRLPEESKHSYSDDESVSDIGMMYNAGYEDFMNEMTEFRDFDRSDAGLTSESSEDDQLRLSESLMIRTFASTDMGDGDYDAWFGSGSMDDDMKLDR
jgi:hypothetical protein